jgi:hypothetical protein
VLLGAALLQLLLLVQGSIAGFILGRTYLAAAMGDAALGGTLGMAMGYSVVLVAVWFLPYLSFALRTAGIQPTSVLLPLWPALRAALLMGLVVWAWQLLPFAASLGPIIRLAASIAIGVGVYGLLARREIAWCWRELWPAAAK